MIMPQYRQFRLINGSGASISLNGGAWFFENPAGLGTAPDTQLCDLRNGFFKKGAADAFPQETIAGDIICKCYEAYRQLADFIIKADELTLGYTPPCSPVEYRRRVTLQTLTKTEKNAGQRLRCPVIFKALTPWYVTAAVPIAVSSSPEATFFGKAYEAQITKLGHLPIALKITTSSGALPHWILSARSINEIEADGGNLYTVMMLPSATAATYEGGTFVYSSAYADSYIRVTDDGEDFDLVDKVVFTNNLFGRIPISDESAYLYIIFDDEETNVPDMTVEAFYYYRTV